MWRCHRMVELYVIHPETDDGNILMFWVLKGAAVAEATRAHWHT